MESINISDVLQSFDDNSGPIRQNSLQSLDPSHYFETEGNPKQRESQLNMSSIPLRPSGEKENLKPLMLSKKTSSLVIDALDESSILFSSDINGPSESDVAIELSRLKESLAQPGQKNTNRRETLKIFKKNREMAKLEEQQRLQEVMRERE